MVEPNSSSSPTFIFNTKRRSIEETSSNSTQVTPPNFLQFDDINNYNFNSEPLSVGDQHFNTNQIDQFQQLQDTEKHLTNRISQLEEQQQTYFNIITRIANSNPVTNTNPQIDFEDKLIRREISTLNKQLQDENQRLSNELQDLWHEFNHCSAKVKESNLRNIDFQKATSCKLKRKLNKAAEAMEVKHFECQQGVDMLMNQIKVSQDKVNNLNSSNAELKKQLSLLRGMYRDMQGQFMQMKEQEVKALKKLHKVFNPTEKELQSRKLSATLLKSVVSEIIYLARVLNQESVKSSPSIADQYSLEVVKASSKKEMKQIDGYEEEPALLPDIQNLLTLVKGVLSNEIGCKSSKKFAYQQSNAKIDGYMNLKQLIHDQSSVKIQHFTRQTTDELQMAILCLVSQKLYCKHF